MKPMKSVAPHAVLAVGGLVLSYLVWTDDSPEVDESEVTIFECTSAALSAVDLRSTDKDVSLELRDEGGRRVAWLTVTRRPPSGDPTTERFVGSDAVDDFVGQMAPLRARRSLGELDEAQLGEVGLAEAEGRLSLRCGGRRATFVLGESAYGSGDRYVRAERGGPAYLVAGDRLSPLESAEFRLMQRELHTFEQREIVSLTVRAFNRSKDLRHHNRLDAQRAEWVDAASPDRRDETYGNWLARFGSLRVQRYLDPDARPGADLEGGMSVAPERVMRIEYQGERGSLGFLEMQRADAEEPAYYARTETTRSWVRVATSSAQQIEDDLRSIFGVAPLERPSPRPATAADAGAAPDAGAPSEPGGDPHPH